MSRNRQTIANIGIGFALLLAASPLAKASPTPVNGVRTALELVAKKPAARPVSAIRTVTPETA